MNTVDNFWDKIAIMQLASGQAPSVRTDRMQKALSGDKEAEKEIYENVNVHKAITTGAAYRAEQICKAVKG